MDSGALFKKLNPISEIDAPMPITPKSTLTLQFKVKPGCKEALLAELKIILDLCNREPEFITAILNENKNKPDEIILFELWKGAPEEFFRAQ